MHKINIIQTDIETFEITVKASSITTHTVTLTADYYNELTGGKISPKVLVEQSFEFLLEREPNTMILSRFDLPVISEYFPEYEATMIKRL